MNSSDNSPLDRTSLAQQHLGRARAMVWLSLSSIVFLPIIAILVGIKSISPRADLPIEGCFYGCGTLFIGSFIPFGMALYAISLYKISKFLSNNSKNQPRASWVDFVANAICICFGPMVGLTYLYYLFTIVSGIFLTWTTKPSDMINKQIYYSLAIIKPIFGLSFIVLSVYVFYRIYKLQFKYQKQSSA